MDHQDNEAAARSYRKECKRQAADLVVSNRLVAEAGVHHTLLFRGASKWTSCMSLEHMP